MSPEQQRIAIAEACGWTKIHLYRSQLEHRNLNVGVRPGDHLEDVSQLPDYLTDLNAMHEAEKVLTEVQQHAYTHKLLLIFERKSNMGSSAFTYAHATAAQRARAFLETLGLWDNGSA